MANKRKGYGNKHIAIYMHAAAYQLQDSTSLRMSSSLVGKVTISQTYILKRDYWVASYIIIYEAQK